MDKSKFYVITKRTHSVSFLGAGITTVVGIALNQIEAEFQVYLLSKERDTNSYSFRTYEVNETTVIDFIDKNSKEFQKFIKERRDAINKQIEKEKECIEDDSKTIKELSIELSKYEIK